MNWCDGDKEVHTEASLDYVNGDKELHTEACLGYVNGDKEVHTQICNDAGAGMNYCGGNTAGRWRELSELVWQATQRRKNNMALLLCRLSLLVPHLVAATMQATKRLA